MQMALSGLLFHHFCIMKFLVMFSCNYCWSGLWVLDFPIVVEAFWHQSSSSSSSSPLWHMPAFMGGCSFTRYHHRSSRGSTNPRNTEDDVALFFARRRKSDSYHESPEDLDRWYESVQENATPDAIFWQEMERQQRERSTGSMFEEDPRLMDDTSTTPIFATTTTLSDINEASNPYNMINNNNNPTLTPKAIEATLAEYERFMVSDNWLDDDLVELMGETLGDDDDENGFFDHQDLDAQLDAWAREDSMGDKNGFTPDEPWDHWNNNQQNDSLEEEEYSRSILHIEEDDPRRQPSEFLFDDNEKEEDGAEEESVESRLVNLTLFSPRLERARNNDKAQAFFQRTPDATEGFDRMWVAAIDNACLKNLVGVFRNYGVQFADNFGDWQDGSLQDAMVSIEDVASFKARKTYNVTGLPCIASRTSFEIEPVPEHMLQNTNPRSIASSPRVVAGYRFNDIGMHVDYMCESLREVSAPERVTRFKTCLCYYDGEMEIFDYGTCDVDLIFANSLRTFIPASQAINEMLKTLELTLGLEYQKWLRQRVSDIRDSKASRKLRDRVLKDGRVLSNDIVDVSQFMDAMVDVELMDECGKELATRMIDLKPNKILTVATTGLVLALPMAKYLQVPVVYARKERSIVMADTYIAGYSSKTVGKNRELIVAKSHLSSEDRILIVDDFLSSGSSQEALLRIVNQAGARAVGMGVLLEKVYDSGRQLLSGFNIPIESLCRIASVRDGVIQLLEEEGFDQSLLQSRPK
jgi:xanthine phosphoribosyltransferase